jgi:hypothetical protein
MWVHALDHSDASWRGCVYYQDELVGEWVSCGVLFGLVASVSSILHGAREGEDGIWDWDWNQKRKRKRKRKESGCRRREEGETDSKGAKLMQYRLEIFKPEAEFFASLRPSWTNAVNGAKEFATMPGK